MEKTAFGYTRERIRTHPVPTRVRFYQAIGALPDTFKNFAFNTFLLLLYNQILGLSASLASIALMLAVMVDAVTDPVVGSYSDQLKSRLGRRHPLMYASVLPLMVSLYLVLSPPQGMSQWALFAWLTGFAIATRVSMTFYLVPWSALFAELSDDYQERSAILTWRFIVGALGGIVFAWLTWTFIFPSTEEYATGQLNPAGYPKFAPVLALAVGASALLTTLLTQREIPYLRQPANPMPFDFITPLRDLGSAIRNRDFMILFVALLFSSMLTGTLEALEIYMNTYFWGFASEQIRWLVLGVSGALIAAAILPGLQSRFDKKHILYASMGLSMLDRLIIIGLRLADVLPPTGDPLLLYILVANEVFKFICLTLTVIMFVSMVADTLDAQELEHGKRQEGVFSAAISFSAKATSGFGIFIAGLILDLGVRFPRGMQPADMPEDIVWRMGVGIGILFPLLYAVPLLLATRYSITRQKHAAIRRELDLRNAGR